MGLLSGLLNRSWIMLVTASLLFFAVMVGVRNPEQSASGILSYSIDRGGTACFSQQGGLAEWDLQFVRGTLVLYLTIRITLSAYDDFGALGFLYYRVFEIPSESLLETFGAFPFRYPHAWGANIRPLATTMGLDYTPAYTIVSHLWHNTKMLQATHCSSPIPRSIFPTPAFSFSACSRAPPAVRSMRFTWRMATALDIAMMAAAFVGVFALLVSALNTAFFSGGLLLAPILAGVLVKRSRFAVRPGHRRFRSAVADLSYFASTISDHPPRTRAAKSGATFDKRTRGIFIRLARNPRFGRSIASAVRLASMTS